MKAISLWQPWASLIALGEKEYETRHWKPGGMKNGDPIAIHAARHWTAEEDAICRRNIFRIILERHNIAPHRLPKGALLCIAQLISIHRTEDVRDGLSIQERAFGNYEDRRYAWRLKVLHVFPKPIPLPGRQGLFEWDSFAYADQVADVQPSEPGAQKATQVVNFHHIRDRWDSVNRRFRDPDIVYCGRANRHYELPESMWHNPFKGSNAIERFRAYVTGNQYLMSHLEDLRGKKLCCWCAPTPCHCDVLLELLGEKPTSEEPKQLSMF